MKLLSVILAFSLFAAAAKAEGSTKCLNKINHQAGAPWSPADKKEIIQVMAVLTELSDEGSAQVVALLKRDDTEAYIPYDSADAGAFVAIFDKKKCQDLWSGFIYNN